MLWGIFRPTTLQKDDLGRNKRKKEFHMILLKRIYGFKFEKYVTGRWNKFQSKPRTLAGFPEQRNNYETVALMRSRFNLHEKVQ